MLKIEKMKANELRELTLEELSTKIEEEVVLYTKMRLTHAISPLENPSKITEARRGVARLKTELRARELAK